ncbi:hypothetical protein GCM10027043_53090 [Ferruginibacter profundus]
MRMKFKLTHVKSDGEVCGITYPTLDEAIYFGFQAVEFLPDMKVGYIKADDIGDIWERIE